MMKTLMIAMAALAMPVALTGCDRTIAEKTTEHRDSNGNVTKETKTVTQDPAGNVTVTKDEVKKTVDNK